MQHRPSGLLRRFVSTISIAATVVMPYAAGVPSAHAADTGTLFPDGQGTYSSWTGDEDDIDETSTPNCGSSDGSGNISESTTGDRESVDINLSTVPNGATITSVEVSVAYRDGDSSGSSGTFQTFARLNGTNLDSAVNLSTSSSSCTAGSQSLNVSDTSKNGGTTLEVGVVKTGSDTDEVWVGSIRATVTYTQTLPDLVAVKTNNTVADAVEPGETFKWTIRVENIGDGIATFNNGELILRDNMPGDEDDGPGDDDDIGNYAFSGSIISSGLSGSGDIECDLDDGSDEDNENLECRAEDGGVVFAPGGYFEVSVWANLNPSASGTVTNPRAGGVCRVDPDNEVNETANSNSDNNCNSNSVTVVEDLCSNISGIQEIIPAGYEDPNEDGVCTLTPPPPPETGTLIIEKILVDAPEGTNIASFSFNVNSTTYGFQVGGTSVELPVGTYALTENNNPNYDFTPGYGGACGTDGDVQIEAGETVTCTVTNTFIVIAPPACDPGYHYEGEVCVPDIVVPATATITVIKQTVGGYGSFHFTGLGGEAGFDLTTTASGSDSEEFTVVVPASGSGSFTITEEIPEGWQLGISCLYDGEEAGYEVQDGVTVYLDAGDGVTCTFTNTLPPPPPVCPEGFYWNGEGCSPVEPTQTPEPESSGGGGGGPSPRATLIVEKVIVFGEDASVSFSDFSFWLDGELHQFEEDGSNEFSLRSGDYMVTEDYASGYTVGYSGDCDENGNLSMIGDETYVCVVTNTLGVGGFNPGSEVPAPTPTPTPTPTPNPTGGNGGGSGGTGGSTGGSTLGGDTGETPTPTPEPGPASGSDETIASDSLTAAIGGGFLGIDLPWWLLLLLLIVLWWWFRRSRSA